MLSRLCIAAFGAVFAATGADVCVGGLWVVAGGWRVQTTHEEWKKHIEPDAAFVRRFTPLTLEEVRGRSLLISGPLEVPHVCVSVS